MVAYRFLFTCSKLLRSRVPMRGKLVVERNRSRDFRLNRDFHYVPEASHHATVSLGKQSAFSLKRHLLMAVGGSRFCRYEQQGERNQWSHGIG